MNTRTIILVFSLMLMPSIGFAQAEENGIDIVLKSQRLIEAEPGRIITSSYLVTNRTGREVELYEKVVLPAAPDGWQPLAAYERPIFLESGKQTVQLVTFVIPKKCPAGEYEVRYSLIDRLHNAVKGVETFTIVVIPVIKFDAIVEDKPDVVMAGDRYNVRLRLVNNGNGQTPLRMETTGSPDFPITCDPVETILEAGKSQLVNISVFTDKELTSATNHVVEISAIAQAPDNTLVTANRSVFVEILPRLAAAIDPRSRVPTSMKFIAVGEGDEAGMQIEYSGSGNLDESGTRSIDFVFRGPDIKEQSIYGTRDMLRLNYEGPLLNLLLGDQTFSLSPLSERLIYGRGGETVFHPGGIELGSFFMETRWDSPPKKEVGAFAGYNYKNTINMKVNYLNKCKEASSSFDGYDADIYSAQAQIAPHSVFNLGLEYAYCVSGNDKELTDAAHRLTIDGKIADRVWYTNENTYAGSGYLGYYNDALYSSGTVAASIYRNLRGNLSYRIYKNNLDLDAEKETATREQSYRSVLSYAFSNGTNMSLDYEALLRRDDMTSSQFDFEENTWRFGLGHSFDKFSFQAYSERASFEDHITGGAARTLYRHNLYAHFYPSPRHGYSIIARMGQDSYTGNPEETASIGFSTFLQPVNSLRVGFNYQSSNINADRLPRQDFLLSTFDFTLPNRHVFSMKVRWFRFEKADKSDYSFFASYTIPFGIPAMKKKSFGSLKGLVLDTDKAGSPPMEKVLITTGNVATMTNEAGEFSFPVLKPGMYAVHVDQRSMGMNRITTEPSPVAVEIAGGKTTFREIGISTSAEISGRIVLYAIDPARIHGGQHADTTSTLYITGDSETKPGLVDRDDLIESGGLEDIIVEISNGNEIFRQTTNQQGRYSFPGIRPGTWQLKVYDNGLPKYHYIEKADFTVELAKGEDRKVTMHVLPKLRAVEIQDGGTMDE